MPGDHVADRSPPAWFRDAIAVDPVPGKVVVENCPITTLSWGDPAHATIVLVHGGAAHAWWWGFVAPLLAEAHHVVALDLSGHGDSGRRPTYDFRVWAREVAAVVEQLGVSGTVVVGHSMGGVVAAVAGPMLPGVGGVVMVDAPLGAPDKDAIGDSEAMFQRVRRCPDRDALVARFRPVPEQPVEHPALVSFVGARSVARHGDGWAWKFDPRAFAVPAGGRPDDCSVALEAAGCPVGAIIGDRSPVVPPQDRARLGDLAGRRGGVSVDISGGHHHLMFDVPRHLATTIDELAAQLRGVG